MAVTPEEIGLCGCWQVIAVERLSINLLQPKDPPSVEIGYYTSSLAVEQYNDADVGAIIRGHWSAIENGTHYRRDVTLGEDACRVRHRQGDDRVEIRRASVAVPPPGATKFPGLAAFGRIDSTRQTAGGKLETRIHYVALSQILSPRKMLEVTRSHWSIENHLHWQLDVVFNEDAARTRKDHAPANLAMIRRIALDILRSHPDKISIARKMNLAAWDDTFFFSLFTQMQ